MFRLVVSVNEQGRMVIPKVARDSLGIVPGSDVVIHWDVDEDDNPIATIRPHRRFCEICEGREDIQMVPGTRRMICGACKTELVGMFAPKYERRY